MKIRFRKNTNIRINHLSLSEAPLGVVYTNTLLDVDDTILEGANLKGDNRWWRDHNGWYYWAGETDTVTPEVIENTASPLPTPSVANPLISDPTPLPLDTSPVNRPSVPTPPMPSPDATPQTATLSSSLPTRPPIAAMDLVALPLPDDSFGNESVPEGEWRSLDGSVLNDPKADNNKIESAQIPKPVLTKGTVQLPKPVPTNESVPSPDFLSPRPEQLNWGLEAGKIPSQWWQGKRLTGQGVTLAILSTGADPQHPDLKGAFSPTFSKIFGNQSPWDSHGLGTQAAILAVGKGRIAFGVAPESKLLIGKIGSTPDDISPESLIAGLEWAIEQKADVAALLVDFLELSDLQKQRLSDVIARALDANMVLLAPVGNSSERKPEDRFPAALEGVISVGAHHSFNGRADFSAVSEHLDFLAPGEGLNTSDLARGFGPNLKNTAIATAYAAGFVALLQQWKKEHNEVYSPSYIAAFLRETAHYEGINKGKDTEMGYGILNPQAVLERLMT